MSTEHDFAKNTASNATAAPPKTKAYCTCDGPAKNTASNATAVHKATAVPPKNKGLPAVVQLHPTSMFHVQSEVTASLSHEVLGCRPADYSFIVEEICWTFTDSS